MNVDLRLFYTLTLDQYSAKLQYRIPRILTPTKGPRVVCAYLVFLFAYMCVRRRERSVCVQEEKGL